MVWCIVKHRDNLILPVDLYGIETWSHYNGRIEGVWELGRGEYLGLREEEEDRENDIIRAS